MATNVGEFVGHLEKAAVALRDSERRTIEEMAKVAKVALLSAPGAPHFLSGAGRNGAKVGVRYKIGADRAQVRWFGPAHLVDHDTSAHEIGPRERGRSRRSAVSFGGAAFAHVEHPGTHGKRFFAKGEAAAALTVPRAHQRAVHDTLATVFTG